MQLTNKKQHKTNNYLTLKKRGNQQNNNTKRTTNRCLAPSHSATLRPRASHPTYVKVASGRCVCPRDQTVVRAARGLFAGLWPGLVCRRAFQPNLYVGRRFQPVAPTPRAAARAAAPARVGRAPRAALARCAGPAAGAPRARRRRGWRPRAARTTCSKADVRRTLLMMQSGACAKSRPTFTYAW